MKNIKNKAGTTEHKGEVINIRCTTEQKQRLQAATEILRKGVFSKGTSQADVLFFFFDTHAQEFIDKMPKRSSLFLN
jgi:hypothetical protein